eukprot:1951657-Rhodomonas_salina.1
MSCKSSRSDVFLAAATPAVRYLSTGTPLSPYWNSAISVPGFAKRPRRQIAPGARKGVYEKEGLTEKGVYEKGG